MELYQAGYYRLGKQGANSGWQVVSPTDGMSQVGKDGFMGIAANMTELKGSQNMPSVARGIFNYDRFVYIMQTNYNAVGEDERGVSYSHGYNMDVNDYARDLCRKPEYIFNSADGFFPMEYEAVSGGFPIVNDIPTKPVDIAAIMAKYQLDKASVKKLILSAIWAVTENHSFSICYSCDKDELLNVYNEIMYVIMKGLPYSMRPYLRACSGYGVSAHITFATGAVEGNVFNLNTKETDVPVENVARYMFTAIYDHYDIGSSQMEDFFEKIEDRYIKQVFDVNENSASCEQIDAIYCPMANILSADNCEKTFDTFLSQNPKSSSVTEGIIRTYLTEVLEFGAFGNISSNSLNNLGKLLQSATDAALVDKYWKYMARVIVAKDTARDFSMLWSYQSSNAQVGEILNKEIATVDPTYLSEYYLQKYLPGTCTDLLKLKAEVQSQAANATMPLLQKFYELDLELCKKSMAYSNDYMSLCNTKRDAYAVIDLLNVDDASKQKAKRYITQTFWNAYDINSFRLDGYEEYYVGAEDIAVSEKASSLKSLAEFKVSPSVNRNVASEVLIEGKHLTDLNAVEAFAESIQERYLKSFLGSDSEDFDVFLMAYYSFSKRKFSVVKWAKALAENGMIAWTEPTRMGRMLRDSRVVRDSQKKEELIASLESVVNNKEKLKQLGNKNVIKTLQNCYALLLGKQVKNSQQAGEHYQFMFSLHRTIIGMFAIFTMALLLRSIWKYYYPETILIPIIGAVVIAAVFIALTLIKMSVSDIAPDELLETMGIVSGGTLIIYIGVILLITVILAVSTFVLKNYLVGIIAMGVIALVSIIATIIFGLTEEE